MTGDAKNVKPTEILLVEDNPAEARLVVEAFRESKMHYHISIVGDGEEAMAFVERKGEYTGRAPPDVILLDLNLPKKDGREVLHDIKVNNSLKHIPVVVLTASKDEEDYTEATQYPATYYVTKPTDMSRLLEFISWFWEFFNVEA
jgi:two-component system, chemotaxis family, response regulator Rcp1